MEASELEFVAGEVELRRESDGSDSSNHLIVAYDDETHVRKSSISFDKIKQISLTYSLQSEEDPQNDRNDQDNERRGSSSSYYTLPTPMHNTTSTKEKAVDLKNINNLGLSLQNSTSELKPKSDQPTDNEETFGLVITQDPCEYLQTNPFAQSIYSQYTGDDRLKGDTDEFGKQATSYDDVFYQFPNHTKIEGTALSRGTPLESDTSPGFQRRAAGNEININYETQQLRELALHDSKPVDACGRQGAQSNRKLLSVAHSRHKSSDSSSVELKFKQHSNSISLILSNKTKANIIIDDEPESCSDDSCWDSANNGSSETGPVNANSVTTLAAGTNLAVDHPNAIVYLSEDLVNDDELYLGDTSSIRDGNTSATFTLAKRQTPIRGQNQPRQLDCQYRLHDNHTAFEKLDPQFKITQQRNRPPRPLNHWSQLSGQSSSLPSPNGTHPAEKSSNQASNNNYAHNQENNRTELSGTGQTSQQSNQLCGAINDERGPNLIGQSRDQNGNDCPPVGRSMRRAGDQSNRYAIQRTKNEKAQRLPARRLFETNQHLPDRHLTKPGNPSTTYESSTRLIDQRLITDCEETYEIPQLNAPNHCFDKSTVTGQYNSKGHNNFSSKTTSDSTGFDADDEWFNNSNSVFGSPLQRPKSCTSESLTKRATSQRIDIVICSPQKHKRLVSNQQTWNKSLPFREMNQYTAPTTADSKQMVELLNKDPTLTDYQRSSASPLESPSLSNGSGCIREGTHYTPPSGPVVTLDERWTGRSSSGSFQQINFDSYLVSDKSLVHRDPDYTKFKFDEINNPKQVDGSVSSKEKTLVNPRPIEVELGKVSMQSSPVDLKDSETNAAKIIGISSRRVGQTPKQEQSEPVTGSGCLPNGSIPPSKRPIKLRNILNGEQLVDNLHNKDGQICRPQGCTQSRCLGSLMNPKPVEAKVRAVEETLEQATDFINNFYASIKRSDSPAHKTRLKEIEEQLRSTETYYLKETELIFGAKLAWRNAARCIGRIQWSKLQVFDARFTSNTSEMFEALCNHIKYATNKGNIRSAITILPARVKSTKNDWRIWNQQLIGFAGYRDKQTGQVIGDPNNADFTEVCQKLGWVGKGTRFDLLPLVLSANGGGPEMFPLPDDLVLRVKIKHPKYKWFEELGLEWYALPAVSNMMLDVGGLQFTAAPFNGWYMVTEIGTRNFGDASRYNMLEAVAQGLELNTTTNQSLWKDQAIVQLNIAVLDSFQSAGVTIVDHHTASETFMTHLANEQRLRGGCPADWIWLVPPTSGSTTQVFHQEMINYHMLPNYEYMEPMWKNFDWMIWKRQQEKIEDSKRKKTCTAITDIGFSPTAIPMQTNEELTPRKLRFKEIARAVKFTSKLFGKALSRRIKATILYATETGRSERFANKLAQTFSSAFNVHLMSMADYDMTCLEHEALLLIVTSTFGNGDAPENGELFAKHLAAVKLTGDTSPDIDSINSVSSNPFFQMMSEDHKDGSSSEDKDDDLERSLDKQEQQTYVRPLSNVRFGVFALGSTAYPHFCAFGRYVDQILGQLGAERILKCTCGDELCGQEKAFNEWSNQVFRTACDVFCLTDSIGPIEERPETVWSPRDVKFVPVELVTDPVDKQVLIQMPPISTEPLSKSQELLTNHKSIVRKLMSITNKKIVPFKITNRVDLHQFNANENLQTLRIDLESDRISLPGSTAPSLNGASPVLFEAGDHVAIYPVNKLEVVQKILNRMQSDIESDSKEKTFHFEQVYTILVKRENMDLTPAPTKLGQDNWMTHDRLPVTSIREALTRYLDITSPPNQEFLLILSRQARDPDEKKRLQQMGRNFTIYEDWKNKQVPCLLSVLSEFKSIKFEPALVTQIPLMKPRFYSVSGISISLTVGVVRFTTSQGEPKEGLCSNYLNTVPVDPSTIIYGYIRSAPAFHMPQDKSIPMILISAGTGIAPFRSFWQQRYVDIQKYEAIWEQHANELQIEIDKSAFGHIKLYFGCRNSNYILYKYELDEMYKNGVLSNINVAFSRPKNCDVLEDACKAGPVKPFKVADIKQARKKMWVQDKLLEDSDDIYRLIMQHGAHVYVCGDVAMADGVSKTLINIFNNSYKAHKSSDKCNPSSANSGDAIDSGLFGDMARSPEDGESVLMNLRNLNRYHEDIFGAKQMS